MLLRIYAKCLIGQDEIAKRRITEALGEGTEPERTRGQPDEDRPGGQPQDDQQPRD